MQNDVSLVYGRPHMMMMMMMMMTMTRKAKLRIKMGGGMRSTDYRDMPIRWLGITIRERERERDPKGIR